MSRFANLADRSKGSVKQDEVHAGPSIVATPFEMPLAASQTPPSRVGRKAIAGYFSPEMSMAMHVCARKNGFNLQTLMTEAFDDILRKYGESPIGG